MIFEYLDGNKRGLLINFCDDFFDLKRNVVGTKFIDYVENDTLKEFILGYNGNILSICIYVNDDMEITLRNKMALFSEEDIIIKLKGFLNPYIRDIKIATLLS